jgi:hypothetical protein
MFQSVLDFLNNPLVKAAMVAVGAWLLRKWPKFVNEAVPLVTGIYSVLTTVIGLLFPSHVPTTISASYSVAMFLGTVGVPWWQSLIFDGILPWLMGYGANRAAGHTKEWAAGQGATQTKPGQILTS